MGTAPMWKSSSSLVVFEAFREIYKKKNPACSQAVLGGCIPWAGLVCLLPEGIL